VGNLKGSKAKATWRDSGIGVHKGEEMFSVEASNVELPSNSCVK
jgi:hypothetical protein